MAFDFSKLNFFSRLDARARVFVLFAGVVGVIFLVYLGTRFFTGSGDTTGASRVASAPQGLQSVPGGTLTPEYYRAIKQADEQARQQAQITGGSAVPTLMNTGGQFNQQGQCVICSDQSANVKDDLDDWVRQGKVSPDVARALEQLADKNVSVEEYAANLDRLVKEGKLTPEQARELLEKYKKQHANALLQESAKTMDALIKSGQLPIDVANQLLDLQKKNVSPADYAAALQELVREGKISPEVAQQLLAQYTQQRAREITQHSIAGLDQMARQGQLTPDVEKALVDLEMRMVPLDTYSGALQRFVSAGQLTPAISNRILDEYKSQKVAIGPTGTVNQMLQKAEAAAYGEIVDLLKAGKISQDVAAELTDLIQKNIPLDRYRTVISQLVQQNKLSPEIAKLKVADYQTVKGLREMAARLGALQGNNVSPAEYAEELKRAVQAGLITPEQAAELMQEYQALAAKTAGNAAIVSGDSDFAKLQQRVQQGQSLQPELSADQFTAAQAQAAQESAQDRQARLQLLMNAMSGQAQQLVAAWQPPTMAGKVGAAETATKNTKGANANGTKGNSAASSGASSETPPLIKSGTILFAVLDTAVNSDYPDSPVMATIVDGKYKGAKLLGKLTTAKNVAGQLDRVSLNFTMMNLDSWVKSKAITAYAIDPDTARTVLASQVDYHYLKRFGAMMATSFVQGYANAVMTSSSSTTTGIFGTSSSHPALSPTQKLQAGIGQIGQTVGNATQNYINIPPTVKVDSGVGLGILFMSDVT